MTPASVRDQLEGEGFAFSQDKINVGLLAELDRAFTQTSRHAGQRDLLTAEPLAQKLLSDSFLCSFVRQIFDKPAFVVRATLFDKQPDANWSVTWHQDQTIAVTSRRESPGFGPWSIKNGITHVEPPLDILQRITAVRLHLEDCSENHGPLVVSPRTHRLGRLTGKHIFEAVASHGEQACPVDAGAMLAIKPLTLHRSSKMSSSKRRRVIHLDCTDQPLPKPLIWKYSAAFGMQCVKP